MFSYNALSIFIVKDITYAGLTEFAPNYDHLAYADDLHLHSFFLQWQLCCQKFQITYSHCCVSHKAHYSEGFKKIE